jgi:hypothetical protein
MGIYRINAGGLGHCVGGGRVAGPGPGDVAPGLDVVPGALRHAFCTYHFALYSNLNFTAAQAGNSPAIIHANYRGLATKADAEKWFQVAPNRIPTT